MGGFKGRGDSPLHPLSEIRGGGRIYKVITRLLTLNRSSMTTDRPPTGWSTWEE